jgi:hypothetical protein
MAGSIPVILQGYFRAAHVTLDSPPNFTVRPGTWVTDQTGHIGYTLCLFPITRQASFRAETCSFAERQHWLKSHERSLSVRWTVFDHAGVQLTMRRARRSMASYDDQP